MKVGDYVRTNNGIDKIVKIEKSKDILFCHDTIYCEHSTVPHWRDYKSSDEPIDLVQVGDYVNGEKITRVIPEDVCGDEVLDYQHIFVGNKEIYKEDIKSIVTKEQFESMEYRIGE